MHPILGAFLLAGTITASTPTAPLVPPAAPDVSVAIAPSADGTSFDLRIVNTSDKAVPTLVTQTLPDGAGPAKASEGGKVTASAVSWQPTVPPHATIRLTTTLAAVPTAVRQVSSVCAADPRTGRMHDCASAVTTLAPPPEPSTPWWRSAWLLLGLPLLGLGAWGFWRWRNRTRPEDDDEVAPEPAPAVEAKPRRDYRRFAPLVSIIAIFAVVGGVILVAKPYIRDGVTTGRAFLGESGWYGEKHQALLGAPTADEAVEFTVHRVQCTTGKAGTCTVTAQFRNISGTRQPWYLGMQRLYTGEDQWVQPDVTATLAANGGVDPFARPLEPDAEVLATLKFALPTGTKPIRLELREGPAARGVFINLP
ncbi:hypothetical protein F4553_003667 [Allocatelliglobosispora scoriae]|uniref:DUF4352 domain-containing protein n=1 Tax=Allocatelliglobosispora scoriae TaxID=643052 RepID=A0A841BSA8_9ACTN|nr:hypothetical protein [Allocatelliglobosispora scoriae]MBB5870288.1 hypothetical protein [Allocatelliglobosispora scoriae]